MHNDLETDMVVDVNGILTPVLTDNDLKKIEEAKAEILRLMEGAVQQYYNISTLASKRIAAIEIMKELKIENISFYINHFAQSQEADLLEHPELIPEEVQEILDKYSESDNTYENCGVLKQELEHIGYTIEYGLDAEPFNLRRK